MRKYTSADEIYERTMRKIAPLPCQENYARRLSSILSFHVHKNILIDDGISVDDLPSVSALVVAPTGQGKTYLVRRMTESLGLNCITVDCSTLAAEGWKGVSLSQRLVAAKKAAQSPEAFSKSVLFLDEFDKLRFWGTKNDQGNAMSNLLQLYNSGTVTVEGEGKTGENIDIRRFTIILGGAFEGLDEIVERRIRPRVKIGFSEQNHQEKLSKAELMQQVTIPDLIEFGIMPELLGRIGTLLFIKPMTLEDYKQLLGAESGSIQRRYDNYLRLLYGVRFEIADAGIDMISQKCLDNGTGARAVNPLINDLMSSAIDEVERNEEIRKVILDADENGCIIRYESGSRAYSFHELQRDPVDPNLPIVKIKSRNVDTLTHKLCRYYRNACDNDPIDMSIVPILEPFLNCSLRYLTQNCRKEDFTYFSLEKLARTIQQNGHGKSTFEIMMDDKMICDHHYRQFKYQYRPELAGELVESMNAIMGYLSQYHGEANFQFELYGDNP